MPIKCSHSQLTPIWRVTLLGVYYIGSSRMTEQGSHLEKVKYLASFNVIDQNNMNFSRRLKK